MTKTLDAAVEPTALRERGRAHVASLVEFARTAPTQESQYEATMTARLVEHIIGDADEDGCGPCAALAVDGAGDGGRHEHEWADITTYRDLANGYRVQVCTAPECGQRTEPPC